MTDPPHVPEGLYEAEPLTRQEYISAVVHLYRGEMARANVWRTRLDTTTHWAILTAMGMLSFAFNQADHSHATLLVAMIILINFLVLESRRYLFFDVWRKRVRMVEENFYNPILSREVVSPKDFWGRLVAQDLQRPSFKLGYLQACRSRLVRNYLMLFILLLAAWVVKICIHPVPIGQEPLQWQLNMALGPIPWWLILGFVVLLYGTIFALVLFGKGSSLQEEISTWKGPSTQEILPADLKGPR
ncbi:MAG: DUF2270 domain-containing protein [Acidobacteria bacterium]|nr:DUF2270 domain-containing protein [Acidobacteriota bacterium]